MKDEKEAWKAFAESGSVMDYLAYTALRRTQDGKREEEHNAVQDQGTGAQTTEYR